MKDVVNNPSKYILYFLFIGLVIFTISFFFIIDDKNRNFINAASLFGTVFTLISFIYAFLQLANIKNTSILLKEALELSQKSFNSIIILSTISTAMIKASNIQDILSNDLRLSIYKMKELKLSLLEIKNDKNIISDKIFNENFQNLFENFCVDIKNINDNLNNESQLTIQMISSNLDELITFLKNIEISLKNSIQKEL